MGETNANTSTLATSVVLTNAMGNYFSTPNLAYQFPVKLTSINFLLWKTQFLPMICGCGLNHYIDGSEPVPPRVLDGDQPNPAYNVWRARAAWEKLVAAYATRSKPLIRELNAQLHNLHCDNATIKCYVQEAKTIVDKLAALHHQSVMMA
ncbi:hypothetical protein H5410_019868 [Solanum commersonii]|uniref:Retrotransposon Copia-like N-terminal domain-containing protein n=1 Tax=Solanum commersonii TaxID=4109 RepID=A0A9J5Z6G3_SOLCO|nr:hypothetical protein H5410_019868 [Solanum commersonii]